MSDKWSIIFLSLEPGAVRSQNVWPEPQWCSGSGSDTEDFYLSFSLTLKLLKLFKSCQKPTRKFGKNLWKIRDGNRVKLVDQLQEIASMQYAQTRAFFNSTHRNVQNEATVNILNRYSFQKSCKLSRLFQIKVLLTGASCSRRRNFVNVGTGAETNSFGSATLAGTCLFS